MEIDDRALFPHEENVYGIYSTTKNSVPPWSLEIDVNKETEQ
jgi:hypothetical protein